MNKNRVLFIKLVISISVILCENDSYEDYSSEDNSNGTYSKENNSSGSTSTTKLFSCNSHPTVDPIYVVALTNFWGYHMCSGTMISRRLILTAANCYDKERNIYACDAYTRDQYIKNNGLLSFWCPTTRVYKVYNHPRFNKKTLMHNIAIMKLIGPLYSTNLLYVNLPSYHPQDIFDFCPQVTLMGWGRKKRSNQPNRKLSCIDLSTIPLQDCQNHQLVSIYSTCTKATIVEDSCLGDLGSPLMCGDTQYGILSHIMDCKGRWPGVYTRVDEYLNFIEDRKLRSAGSRVLCAKFLVVLVLFTCRINFFHF
ncbi:unnamed protein product [Psylliodes chrysocephalus]|uniref:trypsin n=1 Tax=Psylliodes chrysocephalus TaxID=3402493 RepID=A0A9P0GHZ3_9CUCU|nr:unnamed protein product [Psylliodes chrysocephala]